MQRTPSTAAGQMLPRLISFFELGKFKIVELWLGYFVGVSLLGQRAIADARSIAILLLILAAGIPVIAATCSLDDIVGVRDGVDQANHLEGARWGVNKPILEGKLAEKQAFAFVYVLSAFCVVSLAGVLALAWPLPTWFLITLLAMMVFSLNYSYGLKLSYRGAGELVIFVGGAGTVLVPFVLIAKSLSYAMVLEALLIGAWHAQVVVFSNSKDAAGDRATGRMTIAARTSKRGNKIYIVLLFVCVWAVTAAGFALELLPITYAAVLAPVWALQIYQLVSGVGRERWLVARLTGFRVLRLGIALLTLANVFVFSATAGAH